jgi:hypothetical protein
MNGVIAPNSKTPAQCQHQRQQRLCPKDKDKGKHEKGFIPD